MRASVLLCLLCLSSFASPAKTQPLEAQDLHIMSIVIDSLVKGGNIYLHDSTYTSDRLTAEEAALQAAHYTGHFLGDWYTRNAINLPIPVDQLVSQRPVISISHQQHPQGGYGYAVHDTVYYGYEAKQFDPYFFPVELSAPGYNTQRDTAFVQLMQHCIGECGTLWSVILRKTDAWRISQLSAHRDF